MFRTRIALATALLLTNLAAQAQTCRDDIAATAPDSRFEDNGDGTVTDISTGLIWKQCAEGLSGAGCASGSAGTFAWQQALQQAADAVFAGSSDWRLPSKNELVSLVERRCYNAAINAAFFPNTPYLVFWSSSPNAIDPGYAWSVYFNLGSVSTYSKSHAGYVRLVRGGQ